ncbi:YheT family hydrolase [Neisseria animalis]|uniref:Alpha/beta fold hydrolase n=1 Tax=Neisseria animalis TaxID=492 RepID=A0A5P3MV95_NEIAN|nr:alpha/beta fold hydrolase [Neisseria animalis]QEY24995.1 alpha/beta fold hydrolase [Neisseria animalis]ROW32639.1 alpha/beta fold hydrolase [Neisseria animalis]VEE06214.1 putative hydrolase [Neisseria animalis]
MNATAPNTPFWLCNGNADTLFSKLLQGKPPAYRRELLPDSTGETQTAYDFIDSPDPDVPLLVVFHGLEGSSRSHYAIEMMKAVQRKGWHGVVAHFRSCGGITNTAPVFYHSGDTREIGFMLDTLAARYPKIYAVGVSLGGNALAKYLGEQGRLNRAAPVKAAAAVSAPVDLAAAGTRFDRGLTRLLYTRYFLNSLVPKARAFSRFSSAETRPARLQTALSLSQCKTLGDFDDLFTAPLHGFADRHDYYRQSSCKPFLKDVAVPLLLLNAVNDPFLPPEALPSATEVSPSVTLLQPPHGGHVGFVSRDRGRLNIEWLPKTVLAYFDATATP